MKKTKLSIILVMATTLFTLNSCTRNRLGDVKTITAEITFNNGDKDTVVVKTRTIQLNEGDLSIYLDNDPVYSFETVASGVRTFKILNSK